METLLNRYKTVLFSKNFNQNLVIVKSTQPRESPKQENISKCVSNTTSASIPNCLDVPDLTGQFVMLIEFSVKNYRSFWESQTLSMVAGASKELRENNTFSSILPELPGLLRSAVVYGANGGGKSNLVKALDFMRDVVLLSARESQEGEQIDFKPFFLHPEGPSRASEFEVVFVEKGVRYSL